MQQSQLFISFASVPLKLRIENALVSYILYIFKSVWPFNLAVFYPFPKVIAIWKSIASGVLVIFLSIISLYFYREKPYVFVGWFWFVGTLVPVIGFIQAGLWPAIADRWMYVPMIGIFIIYLTGIKLKIRPVLSSKITTCLQFATVITVLAGKYLPFMEGNYNYLYYVTGLMTIVYFLKYIYQ